MISIVRALVAIITTWFRSRLSLQLEIVARTCPWRWIALTRDLCTRLTKVRSTRSQRLAGCIPTMNDRPHDRIQPHAMGFREGQHHPATRACSDCGLVPR